MAFPGAPGFMPPGMNQWGRGMPPQMGPMGQMGHPGMGMMPRGMPPRGAPMPMGPMGMGGFRGPGFMQPNMNPAAANAMAHANTTAASILGGAMPPNPVRPNPIRTTATLPEGEQVIENWSRVHNPKLLPPGPPAKPPKNSQKRMLIEKLAKQCALSEANMTKEGKGNGCEALIKAVLKKQPQNTNFNFLRAGIDAEGRDYFRWVLYAKIKELTETQMDFLYRLHCQALASIDDSVDVPPCPAGLVPESVRPAGSSFTAPTSSASPAALLQEHQAAEEAKRKATEQKIQKYQEEAPKAEKEKEKPAEPEEPMVNPMEALTRAMAYAQSTAPQTKKEPVPLAPPLPMESTLPTTPSTSAVPPAASPAAAAGSAPSPTAAAPPAPTPAPPTPTAASPLAAGAPISSLKPALPAAPGAPLEQKDPTPAKPPPAQNAPKDIKNAELDFYAMLETKEDEKPMPPAKRRKKK